MPSGRETIRDRNIRRFLIANVLIYTGIALQLAVLGKEVYDITGRESDLAWLGLAEYAPAPFLVDSRGRAYPVGPGDETANLGYSGVDEVIVPQDWLELFEPGVALTIDAARCPPSSDPDGGCE